MWLSGALTLTRGKGALHGGRANAEVPRGRASRTVIAIGIEGRADVKGEAQSPLQQDSEVGVSRVYSLVVGAVVKGTAACGPAWDKISARS